MLRKLTTFRDVTTGLPAKWRQRNECTDAIRHTDDVFLPRSVGSASDRLKQISIQ